MIKSFFGMFAAVIVAVLIASNLSTLVQAASPDGTGPWADEVVSSSQASTKAAGPVSTVNPDRSHPEATLGEAENDTVDSHFFSLGFGGSITLRFDNGISNGVFVVESTNPDYQLERANIEISEDGVNWYLAGTVTQDGSVSQPEEVSCASYVRITDASNSEDFYEDTADGYDVDGVRAEGEESCTPTEPDPTPTPTTTPSDNGGSANDSSDNDDNPAPTCGAQQPPTPSLLSVSKTSPTTAQLSWSAVSPVSHYTISYGTSPGNYLYGVPNTGNTTSFSIGGLDPNTSYYFVVRAVNDCAPSDASGELSTSGQVLGASTGGQVLGASTDTLADTGADVTLFRVLASLIAGVVTFFLGRKIILNS